MASRKRRNKREKDDEDLLRVIEETSRLQQEEEDDFMKAIAESNRLIEIETQNKAYEETILADSIKRIEEEERQAHQKKYQEAGLRIFPFGLESDRECVSISVMLPSQRVSRAWPLFTCFGTILEWTSTELIKGGENYLEDEISLTERGGGVGSSLMIDPTLTLQEAGITEPTVFLVQYYNSPLKTNKRQRIYFEEEEEEEAGLQVKQGHPAFLITNVRWVLSLVSHSTHLRSD